MINYFYASLKICTTKVSSIKSCSYNGDTTITYTYGLMKDKLNRAWLIKYIKKVFWCLSNATLPLEV